MIRFKMREIDGESLFKALVVNEIPWTFQVKSASGIIPLLVDKGYLNEKALTGACIEKLIHNYYVLNASTGRPLYEIFPF